MSKLHDLFTHQNAFLLLFSTYFLKFPFCRSLSESYDLVSTLLRQVDDFCSDYLPQVTRAISSPALLENLFLPAIYQQVHCHTVPGSVFESENKALDHKILFFIYFEI